MRRATAALACLSITACKDPPREAAQPAPSASTPPVTAAPRPSASAAPRPLELKSFQLTSGVYEKDAVDDLTEVKPGERVYAHFKLKNPGERRVLTVVFKVNGATRTTLELKVEPSPSYRTWGFNTLRAGDKGELSVVATDDAGLVVAERTVPIKR
ncbi:MAG: hypothetical protein IT374_16215 [Polyangiaceae bacterium]|nr:hypothetical protein [Polyangiaceae bacterium]